MLVPIEQLRVHIGLQSTDTSKDVEIMMAYDASMNMIERYLDRGIDRKQQFEQYAHFDKHSIHLFRYPIDTTSNIVFLDENQHILPNPPKYHVDIERGILYFDTPVHFHSVSIDYMGGFTSTTLEKGLMIAGLNVFDAVYSELNSKGTSIGDISRITIPDVGTIAYDTASTVGDENRNPYITGATMFLLEPYKRKFN